MALLLDELRSADGAAEAGAQAWRLAEAMYPLCRSRRAPACAPRST